MKIIIFLHILRSCWSFFFLNSLIEVIIYINYNFITVKCIIQWLFKYFQCGCLLRFPFFFFHLFLLKIDLPTYSITPNAHPIKCPPQCASPGYPTPCPPPLLQPFVHFPELEVSHGLSLSNISHSVPLLSLIIPFTISYIPRTSETIWWLSFFDWLISLSIVPSSSIHIEANGRYSSFLMANIPLYISHF